MSVLLFQLLDGLLEIVGKTYYQGFILLMVQKSCTCQYPEDPIIHKATLPETNMT